MTSTITSTNIIKLLSYFKAVSFSFPNCYFWHPKDFLDNIFNNQETNAEFTQLLTLSFHFFYFISTSSYLRNGFAYIPFREALENKENCSKILKLVLKYIFVLQLLSFYSNQLFSKNFTPFIFILKYRGLSQNGFHLLKKFSICQTPKTSGLNSLRLQNSLLDSSINASLNSNFTCVFWYDNLTKFNYGKLKFTHKIVDCTVEAKTIIPVVKYSNMTTKKCFPRISVFQNIVEFLQIQVLFGYFDALNSQLLLDQTNISNPIVMKDINRKYTFLPQKVHDFKCGNVIGCIHILIDLFTNSKNYTSPTDFVYLTVDYDVYWRISKILYSKTFEPYFAEPKKNLVLVLAPWHIYMNLSTAVWETFNPIILANLWIKYQRNDSLNRPPLNKQLDVWISIWKHRERIIKDLKLLTASSIKECLLKLVEELIPMVFFIYYHKFEQY